MSIDINSFELSPAEYAEYRGRNPFVDHLAKILGDIAKHSIKIPTIVTKALVFVRRSARSVRSAVRQTFAARKAAKTADGGGGSSDPDGRRPTTYAYKNPRNTLPVFAFILGGAR